MLRTVKFAVCVPLVVLAGCSVANPGAIWLGHDTPPATLEEFAHPTGAAVLDFDVIDEITPRVDRLRNGGAEVYAYVDIVEASTGGRSDWEERGRLYGNSNGTAYTGEADVPSNWWWRSASGQRRSNWPNTWMLDIRKGSAFSNHVVDWADGFIDRCHCDGLYLDVLGARLWSSAWDQMSATERIQWSEGAYDLVTRLRARLDPDGDGRPFIVANNTWAKNDSPWSGWPSTGHSGLNGFVWERHSTGETAYYDDMVRNGTWDAPRRMMVIPRTYPDDCGFWDERDTVDVVLCTAGTATGYDHIPSPQTPFRPRTD